MPTLKVHFWPNCLHSCHVHMPAVMGGEIREFSLDFDVASTNSGISATAVASRDRHCTVLSPESSLTLRFCDLRMSEMSVLY